MTRRIRIEVTREDILHGEPREPHYCPIALATKRAIPDACRIEVIEDDEAYWLLTDREMVVLPEVAQQFVEEFDETGLVLPIEFDLEID